MEKEKVLEVALEHTRKAIEAEQEEFIILCPKCGDSNASLGRTIYDEYIIRCGNRNCSHKEICC